MSASGDLNPNAIRVMSRILVFTDSMRPFDRPCSMAARRVAVFDDVPLQLDEGRDSAPPRPPDPDLEGFGGLVDRELEDQPEAFFEQVAPVQSRVGSGDPGEFGLLSAGEVLGVLPQRIASVLERLRVPGGPARTALPDGSAGFVPGLSPDLVKGVGGPPDHVEGISAADRVDALLGDHGADSVRAVRGHVGDRRAAVLAESVEEQLQGGLVAAGAAHTSRPLSWSTTTVR